MAGIRAYLMMKLIGIKGGKIGRSAIFRSYSTGCWETIICWAFLFIPYTHYYSTIAAV